MPYRHLYLILKRLSRELDSTPSAQFHPFGRALRYETGRQILHISLALIHTLPLTELAKEKKILILS